MPRMVRDPETGTLAELRGVKSRQCAACPWRRSNWGRTDTAHPEFNTPGHREAMWDHYEGRRKNSGVRHGATMLCHLGAPPEVGGTKPGSTVAHECAAARVLTEREVLRYHARRDDSEPMTYNAMWRVVCKMLGDRARYLFRLIPREELLAAAHPLLADPEIGHDVLEPPGPDEFTL